MQLFFRLNILKWDEQEQSGINKHPTEKVPQGSLNVLTLPQTWNTRTMLRTMFGPVEINFLFPNAMFLTWDGLIILTGIGTLYTKKNDYGKKIFTLKCHLFTFNSILPHQPNWHRNFLYQEKIFKLHFYFFNWDLIGSLHLFTFGCSCHNTIQYGRLGSHYKQLSFIITLSFQTWLTIIRFEAHYSIVFNEFVCLIVYTTSLYLTFTYLVDRRLTSLTASSSVKALTSCLQVLSFF